MKANPNPYQLNVKVPRACLRMMQTVMDCSYLFGEDTDWGQATKLLTLILALILALIEPHAYPTLPD